MNNKKQIFYKDPNESFFISLNKDAFYEGFATLMSHYALMYCISKDTNRIPIVIDLDFRNTYPNGAMAFFNRFNEPILSHKDVFTNLKKYFKIFSQASMGSYAWMSLFLEFQNYEQLIEKIKKSQYRYMTCKWTLNHNMYIKYLDEICNELYIFDDSIINLSKKNLPKTTKDIVGVCVRNEYKKSDTAPFHVKLSMNFYEEAFSHFNNVKFLIFSDDIVETKENFNYLESKYDIEYTNHMPSAIGLCSFSLCNHIISANSSFSYWAGILNKNNGKKVICPTRWLDIDKSNEKVPGLHHLGSILNYKWYPSEWIALETV